ncbi:arsenate reductase/protein-tyrosine-phosphatase family protein [Blastococcus sp. SYSU DS0533]
MPDQETVPTPVTVLLVCTGNICRSAMGEGLGRAYLRGLLGDAASDLRLVSAGTRAVAGSAMHPRSALVISGYGGDPEGFVARQLEPGMVAEADLVLTLTREHRRSVLELVPRALARTFTLREAAALLDALGDRQPEGEGFADRARGLVAALAAARPGRRGEDGDDIADPIGRSLEGHEEVGQAVADALLPVLAALLSLHPAVDGDVAPGPVRIAAHRDQGGADVPSDEPGAGNASLPAALDHRSAGPGRARRAFGAFGRRRRPASS